MLTYLERHRKRLSPALILTHDNPDPDAMASAYALQFLLKAHYGVRSRIGFGGVVGRMENQAMVRLLGIPVRRLRPGDLRRHQSVLLVDTQPAFSNNPFPASRRAALVLDQHLAHRRPSAGCVVIDTECGATSALAAEALFAVARRIPRKIATALVYGILTDTQNFLRAGGPAVVNIYRSLLPLSDPRILGRIQHPTRSREYFRSLAKGIRNALQRRGLIVSHLGAVENPDLVALVADALLTYEGVRWSLCTGRYRKNLHVSLRATEPRPFPGGFLRRLLRPTGSAGGHGTIAGGQLPIDGRLGETAWRVAERRLMDEFSRLARIKPGARVIRPFRTPTEA
jgi:nanoRNase/pAp phosphatase (c-di-AMP/oligoRNAs hydrolase)